MRNKLEYPNVDFSLFLHAKIAILFNQSNIFTAIILANNLIIQVQCNYLINSFELCELKEKKMIERDTSTKTRAKYKQ